MFAKLAAWLKSAFTSKQRDDQWAARFDNPPAPRDGKLPLDPGKSELS